MSDIERHIIPQTATVLDAIRMLNDISVDLALTLFVIDPETGRMVGAVTDGDIRRAISAGCGLDCSIVEAMNTSFTAIREGEFDVDILRRIKKAGFKLVPILDAEGRVVRILDFANGRSFLPIDAVLMAGGKGERLRPLTLTTPKPLLLVDGKPIIDYNIENFLRHGIEHIHVTTNYLGEQIEAHFAEPIDGVQVQCVREPQYLGTMGSVKFVQEWHNDTILVMNSDLFTNIDLADFYFHFKKHDADMSVAAVPYNVSVPYGIFEIENTREIRGIREKPNYHYYANAGIYLIRRSVLDDMPDGVFYNATDLMEHLIATARRVIRFPLSGYWIDIGKPDDFRKVQELAQHMNKLKTEL
ncbi:nucleotidyltransferase family protein [uncultured Rikenella sp.]|uniref:nucleotidyltransferase family protein n=1 Tax=uncultured Rikenella sp. TaxID=368003 RepID=UPI002627FC33|nr:nucleotidyltransferase family protein [uncultured Rikenella sp.]